MNNTAVRRSSGAVAVIAGMVVLAALSCKKIDAYGRVSVTQNPQGGLYVQSVTCQLLLEADGTHVSQDGPAGGTMRFTVKWVTDRGSHRTEEVSVEWVRGFTASRSYSTTFSAPPGMCLDKDFWVEVTWEDQGGRHRVVSSKAACVVP